MELKVRFLRALLPVLTALVVVQPIPILLAESENGGSANIQDGTLLIGMLVPNGGAERDRGEALRNGATLAVESVNVSGGIHGAKLALEVEEADPSARAQVKAFSELAGRGDLPVIILASEDDASIVKGIADINQTLILSNSMRSDSISAGSFSMRIGRPVSPLEDGIFRLLKDRRVSGLAIVRGEQAWSERALNLFVEKSASSTIQVKSLGRFWNDRGFPSESLLNTVKGMRPEMIYLIAAGKEQREAIDALRAGGITSPLVTAYSCDEPQVAKEIADYGAPVYSIDVAVNQSSVRYLEFIERYSKRFPKMAPSLDTFIGYDAVTMIAEAYKNGAGNSVAMRDFFLKQKTFTGAAGDLTFDENGDSRRDVLVNSIQGGECRHVVAQGKDTALKDEHGNK